MPLAIALVANVVLLVVFALQIEVGPEPLMPADEDVVTASGDGSPCDPSVLRSNRYLLRDAIELAEQAHARAITPLELAAAREQLERMHEQVRALLSRARDCDYQRLRQRLR